MTGHSLLPSDSAAAAVAPHNASGEVGKREEEKEKEENIET